MDSKQHITLRAPDDWHIHLRDGDALTRTVGDAADQFRRAIIMPNLVPPVVNADDALAYKARIEAAVPAGNPFTPLMVIYLTDNTTAEVVKQAHAAGVVAAKLYPAGATTNSDSGVTDIANIYPALEAMQECGMKLLLHGEVTTADIDIFDRERVFIENILGPVVDDFPTLKIVLEHITTSHAVEFVSQAREGIAATITAHHLLYNRNHMLVGGIRPHYYCLPILKRNAHQMALIEAATSGSPKFFLGTDSAPHIQGKKESSCGCAGCYTAFSAIELYAEAFERAGKLDKLEGFASEFGPDFYGLPRNSDTITLVREPWTLPSGLQMADDALIPLAAGETLNWRRV
ncbi:dihydroorotase [Microbulbifer agarilyticus]|uniref:dihydroorotase n=1 Tax=Microbulbifer agarilyticus TaxID=260552 RepID=UPI001C952DB7|nr:dihydroorotase [Microbulbifer agarilyticus]MBY6192108.1 dihydroorotase [Microbulbifer agarilyticus]